MVRDRSGPDTSGRILHFVVVESGTEHGDVIDDVANRRPIDEVNRVQNLHAWRQRFGGGNVVVVIPDADHVGVLIVAGKNSVDVLTIALIAELTNATGHHGRKAALASQSSAVTTGCVRAASGST